MKKYLLLLASLVCLGAGTIWFLAFQPYKGFGDTALVDLPRGTSTAEMARRLAEVGVVRHPMLFQLARALNPGAKLQAGEYEFTRAASPSEVLDRIARGDVHYYEISIPEGSNMFDAAEAVGKIGFLKADDFLQAAKNPKAIRDLAPGAPSLEGFLFPATYRVTKSTTVDQVVKMMLDQFRRQWKVASKGQTNLNVLEMVTLASLVEKESGVASERPIVASVYANRLRKGQKLDADPTTIYAAMLQGRYRGTIYKSDLASDHPYNTYQHTGLPPGPIANPGLASLQAAVKPAETEYLFFVAKGDNSGQHNFSKDYSGHQQFVAQYRQRMLRK
ncbi:aminodeoxychorismate lyase [Bryobacterales bacterium F-183]|nr:aminodeoxychorismate lyase [Bryobacterales bacterium F-183]